MKTLGYKYTNHWIVGSFIGLLMLILGFGKTLLNPIDLHYYTLVIVSGVFVFMIFRNYQEADTSIYFLMALSIMGSVFSVSSYSLLELFISIELISLPGYILVGADRDRGKAINAAVKYFIFGSLSSAILLWGCSFIYGATNQIDFAHLADHASSNNWIIIGMGLMLMGLSFKLTLAPLHFWAVDVYKEISLGYVLFLSIVPKVGVMLTLAHLFGSNLHSLLENFTTGGQIIGCGSMLVGSLGAAFTRDFRKMLAYSGTFNMGLICLGLFVGVENSKLAVGLGVLGYLSSLLGLFSVGANVKSISDFNGLGKSNKRVGVYLTVFLFSLIGIPPMIGFFGKLAVISAIIKSSQYVVCGVVLILNVIGAYYPLRIIKAIWFSENKEDKLKIKNNCLIMKALLIINLLGVLVLPLIMKQ